MVLTVRSVTLYIELCRLSVECGMISGRVFDTFSPNLHQWCIMGRDELNASQFWSKRSKVKVTVEQSMLETALSWLVNTMSWKVLVIFSPNLHQWCIVGQSDECIKCRGQKVTVQGHGGITYAGTITVQAEAYSTRRLVVLWSCAVDWCYWYVCCCICW